MLKHKLLTLFVVLCATTALWASNTITYTATAKLTETTDWWMSGLHTNAFNVTITSHEFSNGIGTITCSGEITTIGDYAFYNCTSLTSVTIPNVTTIGKNAFYLCKNLKNIYNHSDLFITKGDLDFGYIAYYADNVYRGTPVGDFVIKRDTIVTGYIGNATDITIPNSVTTIGNSAFSRCTGLTSVTIPKSVTTIEDYAFKDCSSLTSIVIPNSVTTIGSYAFYRCNSLTSVAIGNSVITIGVQAFDGCSGLTSITIPNSVTTIGDGAFGYCYSLTSITIPNSVTTIGDHAFQYCSSLTSMQFLSITPPTFGSSVFRDGSLSAVISVPCGAELAYKKVSALNQYTNYTTFGDFPYTLSVTSSDNDLGMVEITDGPNCTTNQATIKATSLKSDYHFAQWSDGNKQNPRTLTLMQDTELIAQFERSICGHNLFWNFDPVTNTLTITGTGAMTDFSSATIPWIRWQNQIEKVVLSAEMTSIGTYAFYNCTNLTSIIIPASVISIGQFAFCDCRGLTSVTIGNSVTAIEKYAFYYCTGLTSVTIPNSVTTIGDDAFSYCSKLTSVTLENYFTSYTSNSSYSNSFPSSAKIVYANPITASIVDKKICSITVSLSIPEIYKEWYDEIGLSNRDYSSTYTTYYSPDANGIIHFDDLSIDLSVYECMHCYFYAKKGNEYVFNKKDFIEIQGEKPIVSCSSSSTQTTITLSNISASTDESVSTLTKGIYYDGKRYEADENNKVILTEIAPNKKCTLQVYGCYNGTYYYGDKKYISTESVSPTISTSQLSSTTIYVRGSYTQGDATVLSTSLNCNSTTNAPQGDEGYFMGLKPNTSYSFEYMVNTKEGGTYSTTKQVTTPALELTTLTPKIVSAGTAIVAASTNISDYETNVGFEWRKDNAPEGSASKSGAAIICNGIMEGRLLNLGTDWWKVRPYYEAADGTRYYGDWAYIDPTDASYFEPTVHTYAMATSPTGNQVQVRGYVMTGTDEVTEQGFEYWFNSGQKVPNRMPAATPDSIYRVTASGQVMTAILKDLAYSTTYTCRAYAVADGKTYYGEEVQFLTPEDPRPIYTLTLDAGIGGQVNTEAAGQYREGEQVTLRATADKGYVFVQWSDLNTENPRTITMTSDITLSAIFEEGQQDVENVNENTPSNTTKFLRNGQVIIKKNDKTFTILGQEVR